MAYQNVISNPASIERRDRPRAHVSVQVKRVKLVWTFRTRLSDGRSGGRTIMRIDDEESTNRHLCALLFFFSFKSSVREIHWNCFELIAGTYRGGRVAVYSRVTTHGVLFAGTHAKPRRTTDRRSFSSSSSSSRSRIAANKPRRTSN